jgi:extracellular factor (EF) 3-hydroxypalmitic acid methyl ester biosynthesis protein
VGFHNSQGLPARGSLIRLSRQQVVFEVYNPYSIVQLSEVLTEVSIKQGEREVYHGRAVVTGLMNTGLMLMVSASLVDPWSELKGLRPGDLFRSYVHDAVSDWEAAVERLEHPFQISVGHLRNYLEELNRWLEHWETEAGTREVGIPADLVKEFVLDVDSQISPRLMDLYGKFEETSHNIPKKNLPYHRAFAQRELHPLMMVSPFMYRAFTKPLGYAGDYQMVNMMLGEPWEGASTFAKVLNASALRHDAPAAHRNRIKLMTKMLQEEAARVLAEGRRFRVLNVGCGPASEVRAFIDNDPASDRTDIHLVDFNTETLEFVRKNLLPYAHQRRPEMNLEIEQRSVHEIIQQSLEQPGARPRQYDMVYCAGLFDYFRDATCGALVQLFYSWVSEGGAVLVTNVTPTHSSIAIMSLILEWNLELRDERQMRELAPELGYQETYCDDTNVNVFLVIRK